MSSEQPEQVLVTPENRGPLINLGTWLTLVVMCLATFTKIGSKIRKIGRLQGDDFAMFAAMVTIIHKILWLGIHADERLFDIKKAVAIGQTIAIANQVSAGLGRHIDSLTASQIDQYQKASSPPVPPKLEQMIDPFYPLSSRAMLLSCCIYYLSAWPNSLFSFFSPPSPSTPLVGL